MNSVKWSGWTLLHRAAETGRAEIVTFLLENGADPNLYSTWGWQTPLHMALGESVGGGWNDSRRLLLLLPLRENERESVCMCVCVAIDRSRAVGRGALEQHSASWVDRLRT